MRTFDLYLFKWWSFFSRILAWRSVDCLNRTRRIDPRTFMPFREIVAHSGGSASCDTQPNCRTSFTVATALLSSLFSAFCLMARQTSSEGKQALCAEFTSRCWFTKLTFGRVPKVTFQEVSTRLSVGLPRLASASEAPFSRRISTSWCWWLRGWSGFWCRFCTLIHVVPETTLVSSRTLPSCCPLMAKSFSSCNAT